MTTFSATPAQILAGESLTYGGACTLTCSATGRTLREGDEVLVHVDRHQSIDAWHMVGVYSIDARDVELHGKPDHDEILARGRLAVASDCATQDAELILRGVEVLNARHVGDGRGE
ncbi:MAG: hypothetical protein ACLFSD_00240 [Salinivenus sp.]